MLTAETLLREKVLELYQRALERVDPARLVLEAVAALPTAIRRALEHRQGQLVAVGAGKAVLSMAAALEDALPDPAPPPGPLGKGFQPPPPMRGVVIAKPGAPGPTPRRLRVLYGDHPVPGERSVAAARAVLAELQPLGRNDLAVVLLSGGASSLLTLPVEGVGVQALQRTTELLVRAGAPIAALNCVRKHLSRTGGGALARAAWPASLIALVISDVPFDRLDTIGSGPTVPDPSTYADALRVIERAGISGELPPEVRRHLERGARGELPETAKPGAPELAAARTLVIGNNRLALEAAARRARELGYRPVVGENELIGEASVVGRRLGERLRELARAGRGPLALVLGGETTVRVRGAGRGGRNQELATAAALALEGVRGVVLLAAGTDGEDGPTDAAGALVDGTTAARARAAGIDLEAALRANDTYPALDQLGALVRTGPTGTNVMDVAIALLA
ncbi:MAG: hydroxypyruvate reductase [Planctomycetota bacterium]|nr:MAG: hydroxypyruvate reductase [Planctomycetota bacterium]